MESRISGWGCRASLMSASGIYFALLVAALTSPPAGAEDSQFIASAQPVPAFAFSNFDDALMLAVAPAGSRLVAVGEHGLVLLSDDAGNSWRQTLTGLVDTTLSAVTFVDQDHGWIVGREEAILATSDGGVTWELQHWNPFPESGMEGALLEVVFTSPVQGFAVGANGTLLHTADAGNSWQRQTLLHSEGFEPHLFDISSRNADELFITGEQGSLWRSTDLGATWRQITVPFAGSLFGVLPMGESGLLVYAMLGKAFYSPDSGATWQSVTTDTRSAWMNARESSPDQAVLVGYRGTLGLFDAGTATLTLHPQDHRRPIADLLPLPDGQLVLVGKGGAWRTSVAVNRAGENSLTESSAIMGADH